MNDLRVAAIEAGIHPDAFDRAAAEIASVRRVDEGGVIGPPSRWAPVVDNLKAVLAFWVVLTILTRLGHLLPEHWMVSPIRNILACGVGVWVAIRLRAAVVRVALTGMASALMALFAVHAVFGIQSAKGGPTQVAVLIAGLLGAGAVALLSRRSSVESHRGPASGASIADAMRTAPTAGLPNDDQFRPLKLVRLGSALGAVMLITSCAQVDERQWDEVPPSVSVVVAEGRADAPEAFRLEDRAVLVVGGTQADPDDELDAGQGYLRAARLGDGGLAVIDVDKVRVYDATGALLRTIGRRGAGPQEFRYLTAICATRGDTIVVHDTHNTRLGVIDPHMGTIVRMISATNDWLPPSACLADGTFVVGRFVVDSVAEEFGYDVIRRRLSGDSVAYLGRAMRSRSMARMEGAISIAATEHQVHIARPQFSEVRAFAPTGELSRVLRMRNPIRELSATKASVLGAQVAAGSQGQVAPPEVAATVQLPFFQRVMGDPAGRIWIQDLLAPGYTTDVWTAYESDGTRLGTLSIPRAARGEVTEVIAFVRDGILMRRNAPDGAAIVGVYPLERLP